MDELDHVYDGILQTVISVEDAKDNANNFDEAIVVRSATDKAHIQREIINQTKDQLMQHVLRQAGADLTLSEALQALQAVLDKAKQELAVLSNDLQHDMVQEIQQHLCAEASELFCAHNQISKWTYRNIAAIVWSEGEAEETDLETDLAIYVRRRWNSEQGA